MEIRQMLCSQLGGDETGEGPSLGNQFLVAPLFHHPTVLEDYDQVVVLEHGRIAEQGRYVELIDRGGVFSGLVATQRAGIESA